MEPLNVDGVRAIMGDLAGDMTDEDIRVALVRLGCERWPNASNSEVEAGIRRFAEAMTRAEVLEDPSDALPFWFDEWWREVSGDAPTTD